MWFARITCVPPISLSTNYHQYNAERQILGLDQRRWPSPITNVSFLKVSQRHLVGHHWILKTRLDWLFCSLAVNLWIGSLTLFSRGHGNNETSFCPFPWGLGGRTWEFWLIYLENLKPLALDCSRWDFRSRIWPYWFGAVAFGFRKMRGQLQRMARSDPD